MYKLNLVKTRGHRRYILRSFSSSSSKQLMGFSDLYLVFELWIRDKVASAAFPEAHFHKKTVG